MRKMIKWQCTLHYCYYWSVTSVQRGGGLGRARLCVLVARLRRCLTLSNPVHWQNWMAAYLGYTLRMKMLFRGWPVMVHDKHTRRRSEVPVWPIFDFRFWGQITPKVKIFENVFPDSAMRHRTLFRDQIWWNRPLQSCRKVLGITTHKKTWAPRDSSQPQFYPKWADRAQNSLNVVTRWHVHVYRILSGTPDRLRFTGLIPERLIFRPQK